MKQCEERNHAENQTTDDLGNPVNMQKWGQQDEDSISGKPQFQNGESIFESSYRKSPNRSRSRRIPNHTTRHKCIGMHQSSQREVI